MKKETNKLTFIKIAELTLEKVRKPLTTREIWENAVKLNIVEGYTTSGKTPWHTIGAFIYLNIRDSDNPTFYQYSKRPATFYLVKFQNEKIEQIKPEFENKDLNKKKSFNERDLHPLVVKFLDANTNFKAKVKTIYHENSSKTKKGLNKWLHPDLVAIHFPFDDYEPNVLEIQKLLSNNTIKLFSFEVKINLDFSNLRESYFQAVSNSSWANEGYLIALNISDDSDFNDELRRLNNAFGIGLIKLNSNDIYESEIFFPSKIKQELDWETIDRLCTENIDYENFIKDSIEDLKLGKVKSKYDKILTDEELEKLISDKQIINCE